MGSKGTRRTEIELSYVLPTHNRVEYLGECLRTLVDQEYPKEKYEIIIVDDGSTDSTQELVEFFKDEHPNLSYYKLDKVGVAEARNYGNKLAKGPIIGVCDSDDLYHPKRTKITLDFFKSHPDTDIMNGSYFEINHRGAGVRKQLMVAKQLKIKEFYSGVGYFCHDNSAYKREKILKTPYHLKGGVTDDWNLVKDWVEAGYKFGYTKKELCQVRTLRNGIMGARRAERGVNLSYA